MKLKKLRVKNFKCFLDSGELQKRGGEPFRCLPVRNFETFLLDADSVVAWLLSKSIPFSTQVSAETVASWLGTRRVDDDADGATILEDLLHEFSGGVCVFQKTRDSVELTKLVLQHAPSRFDRLVELLKPILPSRPASS